MQRVANKIISNKRRQNNGQTLNINKMYRMSLYYAKKWHNLH